MNTEPTSNLIRAIEYFFIEVGILMKNSLNKPTYHITISYIPATLVLFWFGSVFLSWQGTNVFWPMSRVHRICWIFHGCVSGEISFWELCQVWPFWSYWTHLPLGDMALTQICNFKKIIRFWYLKQYLKKSVAGHTHFNGYKTNVEQVTVW